MADFAVVGPYRRLIVAEVRHVVANVKIAAIAHGSGEVAHFIDAVAMAEDVPARSRVFWAEEWLPLHGFRNWDAGEAEDGRGVINKAHEAIGGGAGFAWGEVLPLFGEPNHERHVHATVEQRAFVAGHAAAVVAVKKDDGVFGEAIVRELLQDSTDLFVHRRDAIVKARDLAPDERRVRIIRRQQRLGGVMDFAG